MAKAKTKKRKPRMGKAAGPRAPVTLHCPHCKQERIFGHDPYLDAFRCMGCGISTRDFYVRSANRLWDENREKAVERAILDSGVTCSSRPKVRAQASPPPKVTWQAPEEKTVFHQVTCACGATWQAAAGLTTCPRCLRAYRVGADGTARPEGKEEEALRCPSCGAVVADRPEKGAAYLCLSCDTWVGADAEGRKVALAENARKEERRAGRPPAGVLVKCRELARAECCNFEGVSGCAARPGGCVFFAKEVREPEEPEEPGGFAFLGVPGKPTRKVWDLGEGRMALYTDSLTLANAALEKGLSLMATYAKAGFVFAVQFAGPEAETKDLARLPLGREVLRHPADETGEIGAAKGRGGKRGPVWLRCRWFEEAVLPLKPELEEAYWRGGQEDTGASTGRKCAVCGKPVAEGAYCSPECYRKAVMGGEG